MEGLEVLHGGTFTTIQDLGRKGYQQFGMPTAGAMDITSFRLANRLVENDDGQACLEITYIGLRLATIRNLTIAVTGGDLMPTVNGSPLPMWQTVYIPKDSEIAFTGVRNGIRSYLAVAGGIQVPEIMESNPCANLALEAEVSSRWKLFSKISVFAVCAMKMEKIRDPRKCREGCTQFKTVF